MPVKKVCNLNIVFGIDGCVVADRKRPIIVRPDERFPNAVGIVRANSPKAVFFLLDNVELLVFDILLLTWKRSIHLSHCAFDGVVRMRDHRRLFIFDCFGLV